MRYTNIEFACALIQEKVSVQHYLYGCQLVLSFVADEQCTTVDKRGGYSESKYIPKLLGLKDHRASRRRPQSNYANYTPSLNRFMLSSF